jgi:hypothetical protein
MRQLGNAQGGIMKRLGIVFAVGSLVFLSGCAADGYYRGNYSYYGNGGTGNYYGNGYYGGNYRNYDYRDRRSNYRDRYYYDRRY